MKKLISSIMFATMLCFCSIVLFACGNDATVSKVSTSLNKTYTTTANIDFSKFVLTITYSDEKTENILASDIEFDINYADAKKATKYVVTTASTTEGVEPLSKQTAGEYVAGTYKIAYAQTGKSEAEFNEIATVRVFDADAPAFVADVTTNLSDKYYTDSPSIWKNFRLNATYSDDSNQGFTMGSGIEFDVDTPTNDTTKFIVSTQCTTAGVEPLSRQTEGNYIVGKYEIKYLEVGSSNSTYTTLKTVAIEVRPEIGANATIIAVTSNLKNSYYNDEIIDFDSFNLTVEYSDGSKLQVNAGEIEFDVDTAGDDTKFIISTASTATENAPAVLSKQTAGQYVVGTYALKYKELRENDAQFVNLITVTILQNDLEQVFSTLNQYISYDNANLFNDFSLTAVFTSGEKEILLRNGAIEFDIAENEAKAGTQFIVSTASQRVGEGVEPLSKQSAGQYRPGVYNINYIWVGHNQSGTIGIGTVEIKDEREFADFAVPAFIAKFKNNNNKTEEAGQNDEGTFYKAVTYTVGDDNEFVFKPDFEMWAVDAADDEPVSVSKFYVNVNLEELDEQNNTWAIADKSLWSFNNDTFGFSFAEDALNKTFRMTMGLADYSFSNTQTGYTPLTFTFTVADGYNVYNAIDLGRINLVDDTSDFDGNTWMRDNSGRGRDQQIGVFYSPKPEAGVVDPYAGLREDNQNYVHRLYSDVWKEFYKDKEYAEESLKQVNGIFLHGDMVVTNDVIPSDYFITEEESSVWAGTLRDCLHPYAHYMKKDFTLNGNLFSIDFSKIKLCMSDCNKVNNNQAFTFADPDSNGGVNVGQHLCESSAFTFFGKLEEMLSPGFTDPHASNLEAYNQSVRDNFTMPTVTETTEHVATIKNVNLFGNLNSYDAVPDERLFTEGSTRENFSVNSTEIWAGCLIGIKAVSTSLVADNCISKNFQMAWESETITYHTGLDINYVKSYDCFTSGLMTWCSSLDKVSNSELKRFGGPAVLIMTGYDSKNNQNRWKFPASNVVVDDNTTLESFVVGDEGWFTVNVASGIAPILAYLDSQIKGGTSNYYKISQQVANPNGGDPLTKYNLRMIALDQNALTDGDTSLPTFTYDYHGNLFQSFVLSNSGTTEMSINTAYGSTGMVMTPSPTNSSVLKDNLVLINPAVNLSASVSIGLGMSFEVVLNQ